MRGRPKSIEEDKLISSAQDIFWKKGYSATSLKDLCIATKAGAGSLYNRFKGGKKELFKKALQQRRKDLHQFKHQLQEGENPIKLIKAFFQNVALANEQDHLKGCIVANTLIEMTFVDDDLQEEAISILKETEQLYTAIIREEQQKGNLQTSLAPEVLGKYLITFWCGINSLRRMYPDKNILKEQIALHLQMIK